MSQTEDQHRLKETIQPVTDALEVLYGKWKLPILIVLSLGPKRFGEISTEIPKITDRMLSRELQHLEINLLVKRTVIDEMSTKVIYSITDHGKSLHNVIIELKKWGILHRKTIIQP